MSDAALTLRTSGRIYKIRNVDYHFFVGTGIPVTVRTLITVIRDVAWMMTKTTMTTLSPEPIISMKMSFLELKSVTQVREHLRLLMYLTLLQQYTEGDPSNNTGAADNSDDVVAASGADESNDESIGALASRLGAVDSDDGVEV